MRTLTLIGTIVLTVAVLVVAPFVGMTTITLESALAGDGDPESRIFWSRRGPRVMLGFLAGAAMSLAGMVFQAMFRNPLATPFTLGVSSGAALGATLYIRLGVSFAILGVSGVTLAAFAGALLAIVAVYGLTRSRPGASTGTLLLAGVAVNFTFSSFILLVHYTSDMAHSFNILRWLMGRLDTVGPDEPLSLLPLMVFGGLAAVSLHRELNLMSVGEEIAVGRGVAQAAVAPAQPRQPGREEQRCQGQADQGHRARVVVREAGLDQSEGEGPDQRRREQGAHGLTSPCPRTRRGDW